jgi:hypothetical protein
MNALDRRARVGALVLVTPAEQGELKRQQLAVALLANPAPAELSHLQRGWAFALGTGVVAALLALAIGSPASEREDATVEGLAPQEAA